MRWLALAFLLPALAGCGEPSFDERYEAAQKKVGTTAAKLDGAMAAADRAAEADRRALEAARRQNGRPARPTG